MQTCALPLLAAVVIGLSPIAAYADESTLRIELQDKWKFGEDADTCIISGRFEDGTDVLYGFSRAQVGSDQAIIMLVNHNWSLRKGDMVGRISFSHEHEDFPVSSLKAVESGFKGEMAFQDAMVMLGIREGFEVFRNDKLIGYYAYGVMRSDVDRFTAMERCHSRLRNEEAERDRQNQLNNRDKDPFAD